MTAKPGTKVNIGGRVGVVVDKPSHGCTMQTVDFGAEYPWTARWLWVDKRALLKYILESESAE